MNSDLLEVSLLSVEGEQWTDQSSVVWPPRPHDSLRGVGGGVSTGSGGRVSTGGGVSTVLAITDIVKPPKSVSSHK